MFVNHCNICNSTISFKKRLCISCLYKIDKERISDFAYRCHNCYFPLFGPEYECKNCNHPDSMPIYSLMDYNNLYCKRIMESFKFKGNKKLAPLVASYISECIDVLDPNKKAIIVSVPSSSTGLKKRGFDQMQLVSKYIRRKSIKAVVNNSYLDIQQKTLNKDQRAEYVKNKYLFNEMLKKSQIECLITNRVIIIDDICTTGSTIYAVASVLRSIGCKDICAATWLYEF